MCGHHLYEDLREVRDAYGSATPVERALVWTAILGVCAMFWWLMYVCVLLIAKQFA